MKTTRITKGFYQVIGSSKQVQRFNIIDGNFKGQKYYWSIIDNGSQSGKYKNKRDALLSLQNRKIDYAPQFDKTQVSNKPKPWELFLIMAIGAGFGMMLLEWLGLL